MRDYLIGGFANVLFYLLLRLWTAGEFGQVPYLVLFAGPFFPLLSPFVFLVVRRRRMALGALAIGAAGFASAIIFNF